MTLREINAEGISKLKQWESVKLKAYKDSVGVWTIGCGHTSDEYFKVGPNTVIDEAKADDLLKHDLQECYRAIIKYVKVPLSDKQYTVITSFIFNVGVPKFASSTLLKKLNKGNYDAVPAELAKWNKGTVNGKLVVIKGLVNRRAAEAGYWASGEFVSSRNVAPKAPATKSKLFAGLTSGGAGTIVAAKAGLDALSGSVDTISSTVGTAVSTGTTVKSGVVAAGAFLTPTIIGIAIGVLVIGGIVFWYLHKRDS